VIIGDELYSNDANVDANLGKKGKGEKPTGLLERKWAYLGPIKSR
jgi:hypothetical protein